jgi:hypothetical protein
MKKGFIDDTEGEVVAIVVFVDKVGCATGGMLSLAEV